MAGRTVLVVGASGVTGRHFIAHARAAGALDVIGLARRRPADAGDVPYVTVDLLDREAAVAGLAGFGGVTDLVHCGFVPAPTFLEQVAPNRALLENALAGLAAARAPIGRVVLVQGMKYYGSHLGPFRTPAKEDDPRHMPPNYYYDQEDLLRAAAAEAGFSFTLLRPHVICGMSLNTPQNLMAVVGVYAALSAELGLPLRFPGSRASFEAIGQATDARLLARAIHWALLEPAAAGEAFNVTNGDFFRWRNVWPRIADLFAIAPGEPQTIDLAAFMAEKGETWDRMRVRHGLAAPPLAELVDWSFANDVLRRGWDVMASTIKARRFGFHDCMDTEDMLIEHLAAMQAAGVLPPRPV